MHAALLVLSVALTLLASELRADTEILKGSTRKSFVVRVEQLDPESKAAGLNEASLAKVVAVRLTKRKLSTSTSGDGEIYARVVVLTSNDVQGKVLGYGAHVELSYKEKALLKRDRAREFMAPIWFKGNVTVANPQTFTTQVVNALATLTDQFLNDYLSVNPGLAK